MESTDLLSGFGSGDNTAPDKIKREHDSIDDFEHLDRDGAHQSKDIEPKRDLMDSLLDEEPVTVQVLAPSISTTVQGFLDGERDQMFSAQPKVSQDHLADKFTDSESEASESPLRAPPVPKHAEPVVIPRPVEHPPEPPAPYDKPLPPTPPAAVKAKKPDAHVIEAEVIFCQMGLDAWFNPERLHPKVEALIYWRDPVKSGAALGIGLFLLLSLRFFSLVSVVAYTSLLVLTGTVSFRIYKNILQAVQKTSDGHPFKWILEQDISLPAEKAQTLASAAVAHGNAAAVELRRLFLVEDLIDSLKFGVVLWCFTYVGAYFYGITLVIFAYVALFTLPKAYEANKAQVDANLELARGKIREITDKVRAAVPIGKRGESDKEK